MCNLTPDQFKPDLLKRKRTISLTIVCLASISKWKIKKEYFRRTLLCFSSEKKKLCKVIKNYLTSYDEANYNRPTLNQYRANAIKDRRRRKAAIFLRGRGTLGARSEKYVLRERKKKNREKREMYRFGSDRYRRYDSLAGTKSVGQSGQPSHLGKKAEPLMFHSAKI